MWVKRIRTLVLLVVAVALAGYVGYLVGHRQLAVSFRDWKPAVVLNIDRPSNLPTSADFSLFWTVWTELQKNYVDKKALDPQKMVEGAISGMVAALGDPYTVFLPPKQNQEAKDDLNGAFEGVGIQLGFKDSRLVVVAPLEGTPAGLAGVKSGDFITHVKDQTKGVDKDTEGMTLPEAVSLIRGPKGSRVELTFWRENQPEPFTKELVRDTIVVKSVTLELRDLPTGGRQAAWLKLSRFGDRTQDEWQEAVSAIVGDKRIKGVVLDLRNNPGGYLEGAAYLTAEFLPPGKMVVTQLHGDGTKIEHKVIRNGRLLKLPLIVLINQGSASAAEIMAGALQDHGRAKIVGVKSFGKGSVQQPQDFPGGAGLHITIARWLRPSGKWIDKEGIKPDVEVKADLAAGDDTQDPQLQKALDLL